MNKGRKTPTILWQSFFYQWKSCGNRQSADDHVLSVFKGVFFSMPCLCNAYKSRSVSLSGRSPESQKATSAGASVTNDSERLHEGIKLGFLFYISRSGFLFFFFGGGACLIWGTFYFTACLAGTGWASKLLTNASRYCWLNKQPLNRSSTPTRIPLSRPSTHIIRIHVTYILCAQRLVVTRPGYLLTRKNMRL